MIVLLLNIILSALPFFSSPVEVEKNGSIVVKSLCVDGVELLSDMSAPLFETCINGKTLSSASHIWMSAGVSKETIDNGGVIQTYHFEGKGEWRGLNVYLDRETFGNEPFLRERLRIQSTKPGKFHFTQKDGKSHFIFPQYVLKGDVEQVMETRIGTFDAEALHGFRPEGAYSPRASRNLSGCHMFHPDTIRHSVPCVVKGPFLSAVIGGRTVLTSYEHASADNSWMNRGKDSGNDDAIHGNGNPYKVTDDDLWFIESRVERLPEGTLLGSRVRRGAYVQGEEIPSTGFYETTWYTISFPQGDVRDEIRDYLMHKITDNSKARKTDFYYNTWGMQRASGNMRGEFTQEKILDEINLAAKLGVKTFIFDDGWQQDFGRWTPNKERLPEGLAPLIKALESRGMTPGIWIGLTAASLRSEVAIRHPEWIIKDMDGNPDIVQWGCPAMDIVGGYYDEILSDLKYLVDQGIRFFKWDGINFFNSDLPSCGHGDSSVPVRQRIDRYNYLLPFRVTSLMRELRAYCPDVVVEIDLTEHERALVGLMPLQEGKFFWMNNGASAYEDFSQYRTKSMRRIAQEVASIIPQEALTYAVYPFNASPWHSLHYNLCTTVQSGHGFWGSLRNCTMDDIRSVRFMVENAGKVLPNVSGEKLECIGSVGSSPEIYVQKKDGWALITAFSGTPIERTFELEMETNNVVGVIGHSFISAEGKLTLPLQFSFADDSRVAFVIGGARERRILSSTGWLKNIRQKEDGRIEITAGSVTHIVVLSSQGEKFLDLNPGQKIVL